jgi:hypothetical protein
MGIDELRAAGSNSAMIRFSAIPLVLGLATSSLAATSLTLQPVRNLGFDVLANGQVVAPVRLSSGGVIVADKVQTVGGGLRFSGLRCADPLAVSFAADDFVSVTPGPAEAPEPVVRFKLTLAKFDAARWEGLFGGEKAPFHFLICSMPSAKMWHQRGWLNATPNDDPFPLLGDRHAGTPEISCLWNRHWSYICPLGAHPIPMIGLWDPESRLYVGYDFQSSRASDQSERYIATAYCWRQGKDASFVTLAFPYGGLRYGELVLPKGGATIESHFQLIIDTNLPPTEDPNERFQERLFARAKDVLPVVPAMNDLGWMPGPGRLKDFAGAIGLDLFGPGGEHTFYPEGTVLPYGWGGHREMPIAIAARQNDTAAIERARARLQTLLEKYARRVKMNGDTCLFWEKPLEGAWRDNWGGPGATTLHNSDAWYPARVLVELYRYDRERGQARPADLEAIDQLFNWARHGVWTRNEFADVPSSPFAIGGCLKTAFLLDYYFTFKNDPARQSNAALALHLADNVVWRYLPIWAMDSDRFDGGTDGSFLLEPNSGRDWAGLACANEASWVIDALTQVYVHSGDERMRYYLRGILQRWPQLYRPIYEASLADCGNDALTEGLGIFDGSGPGRGQRYGYGFTVPLSFNEPIGNSKMRVVAGARACIAFDKGSRDKDVADYKTDGEGACSFRVVAAEAEPFDVSFSYPNVDISRLPVLLNHRTLNETEARRPAEAPSSLYLTAVRNGDVVTIGTLPAGLAAMKISAPLTYAENKKGLARRGPFALAPVPGEAALPQDWNDLHSFAGMAPGEHWVLGVPYWQGDRAAIHPVPVKIPGGRTLFVAYAPRAGAAPRVILSDGQSVPLAGRPVVAWRGWPPIFDQQIVLDMVKVPAGASVKAVDPNGAFLMALTVFDGDAKTLAAVTDSFAAAAVDVEAERRDRERIDGLRRVFAQLPAGKIALLPAATSGPGQNFAARTGLRQKWVPVGPGDFVNAEYFNAKRFPVAFFIGGEHYLRTVNTDGDGDTALQRYLKEGGTLVLLASGPYPLYYGDRLTGEQSQSTPLLAELGLPLTGEEQAPEGARIEAAEGQTILPSVPARFAFPPSDPRVRAGRRSQIDPADRYQPLLSVVDGRGQSHGEVAFYVELGAGPGQGGKVLYLWSTLLSAPQGDAIMGEAVSWVLGKTMSGQ